MPLSHQQNSGSMPGVFPWRRRCDYCDNTGFSEAATLGAEAGLRPWQLDNTLLILRIHFILAGPATTRNRARWQGGKQLAPKWGKGLSASAMIALRCNSTVAFLSFLSSTAVPMPPCRDAPPRWVTAVVV